MHGMFYKYSDKYRIFEIFIKHSVNILKIFIVCVMNIPTNFSGTCYEYFDNILWTFRSTWNIQNINRIFFRY